jgi:LysM repeat protein
MNELEDLIISGRKPTSNIIKSIQRRFAGKGNLTNTEKRKLQALKRKARKNVDIENMFRDVPVLEAVITKGNLSEPFDRRNIKTAKPKKKPIRSKGSAAARDRADIKTAKPSKRESSVKDVAPLGGSSYKIKSGDTLSAIARRNNTTVAALMKLNPKIKDKDKIRAGQFIKVGSPEKAKAKTKSVKDLRGKPTSVAEAKRRGMDSYFVINSKGEEVEKAAVTASELKKSGLTLRQYLNKKKKKK